MSSNACGYSSLSDFLADVLGGSKVFTGRRLCLWIVSSQLIPDEFSTRSDSKHRFRCFSSRYLILLHSTTLLYLIISDIATHLWKWFKTFSDLWKPTEILGWFSVRWQVVDTREGVDLVSPGGCRTSTLFILNGCTSGAFSPYCVE